MDFTIGENTEQIRSSLYTDEASGNQMRRILRIISNFLER